MPKSSCEFFMRNTSFVRRFYNFVIPRSKMVFLDKKDQFDNPHQQWNLANQFWYYRNLKVSSPYTLDNFLQAWTLFFTAKYDGNVYL